MAVDFQRIYAELKKKSFDIALRISDLENALGEDSARIIKLKKSFSKLQSAVNYALYYRKNNLPLEAANHIKYAQNMADYLYKIIEAVEVPKSKVEVNIEKTKKAKVKGFRVKLSRKHLLILVVLSVLYFLFMYLFFIKR